MRLKSVAQSRAERSIEDHETKLKQKIGATSEPAHKRATLASETMVDVK
jgi:hypothetical protein